MYLCISYLVSPFCKFKKILNRQVHCGYKVSIWRGQLILSQSGLHFLFYMTSLSNPQWNRNGQNASLYSCHMINTSYLTDLYISFTLKMESVSRNTIFVLKVFFFQKMRFVFQNFKSPKKIFQKNILNLKFKIPAQNTILLRTGISSSG